MISFMLGVVVGVALTVAVPKVYAMGRSILTKVDPPKAP